MKVNERMGIKTNMEIFGRQFAENGKYIISRTLDTCRSPVVNKTLMKVGD